MGTDQTEYENQQQLVVSLLGNRHFPHAAKSVKLVETHISWVVLAGRYAYKIKKALDLGFLNFTGLEARRFYCSEEIRLNRRLAPKIYLDAIPIGGSLASPEFGVQPAIEYAVRMRRFAIVKQFDHLLSCGKLTPQHMDNLSAVLAVFHRGLRHAETGSVFGKPSIIRAEAMQNFEQLLVLLTVQTDRDNVAKLKIATKNAYNACKKYLGLRRTQGYVRECHGDLHLGNIVLIANQPVPFDGIEFNPVLRWIDVMDEVAFPVMDLLYGQRPDLAYRLLNAYLEATGDYAGVSVLRFYLAYRAGVRAKVNAIRAFQPDHSEWVQTRALTACRNYLVLAAECLTRRCPALIITHGLPGSGKSTFAQAALERLQAIRIRSDVERKRLFGMSPLEESNAHKGNDIYSADATQCTYKRLNELAREVLKAGFPVIVDAAFLKQDEREQFHVLAVNMSVPFVIVCMKASITTMNTRVVLRRNAANDASEADSGVLQMLQTVQEQLLPHELVRTVEFLNEADHGGITADAASWGRLDELLIAPEG